MRRSIIIAIILSFAVTLIGLNAIADKTMAKVIESENRAKEWRYMGMHEGERTWYNTCTGEIKYVE